MKPALAAIVITPDDYGTIARVMRRLAAQTRAADIEILLCAPTRQCIEATRPEWARFHSVRVLETGPIRVIAEAKALGVRAATAPIVAFTEEHAFPAPDWAAALIERHREGHAVVGPEMVNPNPRTTMSWANFVIEYGAWIQPAVPGARSHVPGNNSSYKREVLLAYGERLPAMLDAETLLHWDLGARGHSIYLEPRARTLHLNITRRVDFRKVHREYGRMFAAQRSGAWPSWRRGLYALGSPLIPVIRLPRCCADIARGTGVPRGRPGFWGHVLLALADSAWGEMQGYAAGFGKSREAIFEQEFHRSRYLDALDTELLETLG